MKFGIRIRPIEGFHNWWRLWSIRLGAVGTVLTSYLVAFPDATLQVWALFPQDIKEHFPPQYVTFIGIFIFLLSLAARLVKQEKLPSKEENENDKIKS